LLVAFCVKIAIIFAIIFANKKLYKIIALTPEVLAAMIHHHLSLHTYVPIKTL
jgi:hypothetical protein